MTENITYPHTRVVIRMPTLANLCITGKLGSLPPTNEVWGIVMFLHLSVILFTGERSDPLHAGIHTPQGRHPPGQTPPGILRDTVNKRAVRILVECILVTQIFGFVMSRGSTIR